MAIRQDKEKLIEGFAKKYEVTRLVYFEPQSQIKAAIRREKQNKSRRREKKLALIRRINPTFRDLREDFASTCGANRLKFCRDSSGREPHVNR